MTDITGSDVQRRTLWHPASMTRERSGVLAVVARQGKRLVWLGTAGLGRALRRHGTPILTYHSIDDGGSVVSTSPAAFRWQMEYLHRTGFRSLSLADYVTVLAGGAAFPPRAFVLTFDDGFRNVRTEALPVLRDLGFTATVFVPTGHAGDLPRWEMKEGLPMLPLMGWDELGSLREQGIDIQSHGVRHPHLTRLPDPELERELRESRRTIESRLGGVVDLLCYPYGDHDTRVIEQTRSAGYRAAVTIQFGVNPRDSDPYRLRRLGSAFFAERLAFAAALWGMYAPLLDLRRRLRGGGPSVR